MAAKKNAAGPVEYGPLKIGPADLRRMQCSAAVLAGLWGRTPQMVGQLHTQGVVKKTEDGKLCLLHDSTVAYIESLSNAVTGRGGGGGDGDELRAERIRLTRAQADEKEINNRILTGELIEKDEIIPRLGHVFAELRARVLELPSHARTHIPSMSADDLETLKRLCQDTLRALATDIVPAATAASRERIHGDADDN